LTRVQGPLSKGNDAAPAQVVLVDGSCRLPAASIGSKAWNVNRMQALGLRVPPAIVATTDACSEYFANGRLVPDALWAQIVQRMQTLEQGTGRRFGATQRPLLVSVRSGAPHSMPGMMDTILDLGINASVEAALAAETGNPAYAGDTHRRFVGQYRKVVHAGREAALPADPWVQLRAAVAAVFDSWQSPRAQVYRRNRGLPDEPGTAVMIQAMVFGNLDARSGTGVLFSRNPMTGEPPAWGEWLSMAQGEDVVSGEYSPRPLSALREQMPDVHAELMRGAAVLEADARDVQDVEFTVESGRLWWLQSRVAKRSPQAAVRAAVAFAEEGLISKEEAVRRLDASQVRQLPALQLAPEAAERQPVASGEPACPGVASGVVVIDPQEAETRARKGEDVVLARPNTSPEDLTGIIAATGLITEQGGSSSHAAVVSRELGRPAVVGCGASTVTRLAGQRVTLDGASGRVWLGNLAIDEADETASGDVHKLIEWGLPLLALRLLRPGEASGDIVDLDARGEGWHAALAPGAIVQGSVLESDEGIQAALTAGVRGAVVRHRLPALLACLHATAQRSGTAMARPPGPAGGPPPAETSELALLRLAALKGRASVDILADALAISTDAAIGHYLPLCERALCARSGSAFVVTPAGRARLKALLEEERRAADPAAVVALYEDFCAFDAELKQTMTAWQLRRDGVPNDHAEPAYDRAVLQRLTDLHARVAPLLRRLPQFSPRLANYAERLARAVARIAAGDTGYVARIIHDSYHTVWFELHEDLIALAGLTREALARNDTARDRQRP
jgi:pyruvate,orthophosphate dikinase